MLTAVGSGKLEGRNRKLLLLALLQDQTIEDLLLNEVTCAFGPVRLPSD